MKSQNMHSLAPRILLIAVCSLILLAFLGAVEQACHTLAAGLAYAMQPVAEIQVRTEVVAADKRLNLLDFCEPDTIPEDWKQLLAGVDLGPAPEAGRDNSINPQQLVRRLQSLISSQGMDPKQTRIEIPDKVTVIRQKLSMTREQIEEIYREFVLKKIPGKSPEDLIIRQINFYSIPALPTGSMSYEVSASPSERFLGDVSVTIHFYVDGREIRNLRVSGKVELHRDVVHTARPMKRNEVISESDIQLVRANIAAHPDRYAIQRDQVVGKKLLSSIGPNEPIRLRDLEHPPLIKRGDPVTIFFQQEGVRLSTKGEAKGDGGEGDRIRIRNIDSKKNILCRVVDSQTVEVLP
jgi:flagellar basal body P-ring formation protein FlgA